MGFKKTYEVFSLMVGFAAILILTIYLILDIRDCLIIFEDWWFIRIPEIIIGISVIPYYLLKIFSKNKTKHLNT